MAHQCPQSCSPKGELITNSSVRDWKNGVSIANMYLLDVGNLPRGPAMGAVLPGVRCKREEERRRQLAAPGEFSESQTHMTEIQRRLQDGVTLSDEDVRVEGEEGRTRMDFIKKVKTQEKRAVLSC